MIKYVILKIFDKTAFPHPTHSAMGTACHTTVPIYMIILTQVVLLLIVYHIYYTQFFIPFEKQISQEWFLYKGSLKLCWKKINLTKWLN